MAISSRQVLGSLLTFVDDHLESAYLQHFNTQQVPTDVALLRLDVCIHLAMVAGLWKAGRAGVVWVPALFVAADLARLWIAARHKAAYIRHREYLVCLMQCLYFVESRAVMRHGSLYFCACSSPLAFWLLHLISSALLWLVLIPLGMPVRLPSALVTQAASLLPVLSCNSVRCNLALACCQEGLPERLYEQAAGLLTAVAGLMPFPNIMQPLHGKAACVGVHMVCQLVIGLCFEAGMLYQLEWQRRALFARQPGLQHVWHALQRRRRGPCTLLNAALMFLVLWQLLCLVLPLVFPAS